jgi:hypothetical protein
MGLAVFLFLAAMIVGLALACFAAVILFSVGVLLTRGVDRGRGGFLAVTVLFPFLCVGWMGAAYVGHGIINVLVLDRSIVGSDELDCPLPNGYALSFAAGSREVAALYRPAGWPRWRNGVKEGILDVRLLQMANGYLLGGRGRQLVETPEIGDRTVESYFLLDTGSGRLREFPTLPELEQAAGQLGMRPQLQPAAALYDVYGRTWFDGVLPWLMLVPVAFGCFAMFRWLGRLRARRE